MSTTGNIVSAPSPQVGDIWQEVDPRFERYIRVVARSEHFVRVHTCTATGTKLRHRETACSAERFNGKRGGYKLHKAATHDTERYP